MRPEWDEHEVAGGKVDLGTQGVFSFGELTVLHALEQIEALFHGAVSPGALGRNVDIAAVFAELFRREFAHIGQTLFDQLHGKLVILLEIVGAVEHTVAPVETQPVDVILDGFHVFGILLGGIGIVHAEIGDAAEFLGDTEVDAQSLAVADVQISVGFRREAGVDLHSFILTAGTDILFHECFDKVFGVFDFFHEKPAGRPAAPFHINKYSRPQADHLTA